MMNKYQPITDSRAPIVDFGDTWGRIDQNGKRLFEISKKDHRHWLMAFLLRWKKEDENFTDYGLQYYNEFYHKDLKK